MAELEGATTIPDAGFSGIAILHAIVHEHEHEPVVIQS
jgi:hypothetical protein